jgi:hypothetical protein
MTQVERLVRYLRSHPGATAMQLVTELAMPKYTSRISDARQQGIDIECVKEGGLNRYYLRDRVAPLMGTQQAWSDYWDNAPAEWVANEASDAGSRR